MAPAGLLSSAAPDPAATADLLLAFEDAVADACGVAFFGAAAGAVVVLDGASAPFTPPWLEHAPRPEELDVVPSAQSVVALAVEADLVVLAAFVSLVTSFFGAFFATPPWPEQAPRPDDTDFVPSLQIVPAACPLSVAADIVSAAAVTVAKNKFRDESM